VTAESVARPARSRKPSTDDRILESTIDLLREKGPIAVNIEAVAAASGVAKTTIYRRYESREELLLAGIRASTTEIVIPTDLSTKDTFRWLLRNAGDFADHEIGRGTAAAILINEDPASVTLLREMLTVRARMLANLVSERIDRGDLRADLDVRLVATILLGAVLGQVIRGGETDEEWANGVLTLLWPAFEA
jgi:AcrR family transcriptional regulator